MCVIIYKPKGRELNTKILDICFDMFEDGAGFVSYNKKTKEIVSKKQLKKPSKIVKLYEKHVDEENSDVIFHLRKSTFGADIINNVQPIETNKYLFAHNGTLDSMKRLTEGEESDSAALGRIILDTVNPERNPHLLLLKSFMGGDRLIVMNKKTGAVTIVNEIMGDWYEGLWYSNLRWKHRYESSISPKVEAKLQTNETVATLYNPNPVDKIYTPSSTKPTPRKNVIHKIPYSGRGLVGSKANEIWMWNNGHVYDIDQDKYVYWPQHSISEVKNAITEFLLSEKKTGPKVNKKQKKRVRLYGEQARGIADIEYYEEVLDRIADHHTYGRQLLINSCQYCTGPVLDSRMCCQCEVTYTRKTILREDEK